MLKILLTLFTLFSYIRMSIILQELTQSPASPTANRCPQMASEEDARNMTFEAVQSTGWVVTVLPKFGCVVLMG